MNIDTFSEWITIITLFLGTFVGGEFAKPWRRLARRMRKEPKA